MSAKRNIMVTTPAPILMKLFIAPFFGLLTGLAAGLLGVVVGNLGFRC